MVGGIGSISGFGGVAGLGSMASATGISNMSFAAHPVGAMAAPVATPQPSSTVQITAAAREAFASESAAGLSRQKAPAAPAAPATPAINAAATPPATNPTAVNTTSNSTSSASASATVNAPITIDNVVNQISDTFNVGNSLQGATIDQTLQALESSTVAATATTAVAGASAEDLLRVQDQFLADLLLALLLQQQNQQSIVI